MKHGLSWKSYNIPHDFPVLSVHFLSLFFFPIPIFIPIPDPSTTQGENADHCDQPKVAAEVGLEVFEVAAELGLEVFEPEGDDDGEALQNFPE